MDRRTDILLAILNFLEVTEECLEVITPAKDKEKEIF